MIYQFDSRVRYSEVDENRRITLLSILNYFQDCSSFHSEKIGFGIDYLKEKQCAWVLSSWQIVLGELPVFGQEITVQTWPYSFKGFLGERNFCIRDEKGEKLAWANTLWTYVDLKTGHPTRVPKEEQEAYVLHEKLDMDYAPRKIALPEEMEKKKRGKKSVSKIRGHRIPEGSLKVPTATRGHHGIGVGRQVQGTGCQDLCNAGTMADRTHPIP